MLSSFLQDNTTGRFQKLTQVVPVTITITGPKNLTLVPGMNVTVKIRNNCTVGELAGGAVPWRWTRTTKFPTDRGG